MFWHFANREPRPSVLATEKGVKKMLPFPRSQTGGLGCSHFLDDGMKQLMISSLLCSSRHWPGPEPLLAAWILTACWSCFLCVEICCLSWGAPAQWVPTILRSTFTLKTRDPELLSGATQYLQSPRKGNQGSPLVAKWVGKGGWVLVCFKTCWLWVTEFYKLLGDTWPWSLSICSFAVIPWESNWVTASPSTSW